MTAKKILSLPTNDKKIYRQILAFMNFILQITKQQLDVLSEIIRLNNEYEALPIEKRAKFILSTDMRKEMREALDIEEKQFNGIIHALKNKMYFGSPILNEDGILNHGLIFKPDENGFKIEVNLIKSINQELVKEEIKPAVKMVPTIPDEQTTEFKETVFTEVVEEEIEFTINPAPGDE
jgi:S-adenosylmethionine:tRNA-ribosyltransferase-isomerase (queuine synthetase)